VCPTIVLFSSTTNQFLIGGAFPTELFRLGACLENTSGWSGGGAGRWLRCSSVADFFEYAPSSRLAIGSAALAIPFPIYFQNTL
jgi:hypothetical protein